MAKQGHGPTSVCLSARDLCSLLCHGNPPRCSPRSTLLQTCYCTAPGKAFHHGASTLEHRPEMSAPLYTAELSLQKESRPKASITAVVPLRRMRLPWSETLCWTIPPKDGCFMCLGADVGGDGCSNTRQGHAAAVLVLHNL